ncbi:hypothetical protein B1202_14415 [Acinetobacter amyesii]|uniref:YagK/YfjJ C-terminal domain-containing protein n=1 Tax=Acinetobacter amyesii TaxID=2942470 RepID=A0A1T1GRT8_9GAMM|nr:hypothetical protein B1202_14415 [Acinetobacter amyesii]
MCRSRLLIEIEDKTKAWVKTKKESLNFYTEFTRLLVDFDRAYCGSYCYFGYINAWCDLLEEHDIHGLGTAQVEVVLRNKTFEEYQSYFKGYRSQYRKDIRRHRANEVRNTKSFLKKIEKAIQVYSKSEVVRVDLSYLKDCHDLIDIENFYDDIGKFRKEISKREGLFNNLVDYAWALEQGADKGYHCHLLLIFNGHKHQNGWAIAEQLGKLWKQLTAGQGHHFNCHDTEQIKRYASLGILGIGKIHRDCSREVEKLCNAGAYLVNPEKEDQYLRVKHKARMRTFQ